MGKESEKAMTNLTRQIKRYCDPKYRRYDLGLPWKFNRRIVATNGRIFISASPSVYQGDLAAKSAKVPRLKDLIAFVGTVEHWTDLQLPPVCRSCRGKGSVRDPANRRFWLKCDKCTIDLCGCLVSADRYEPLRKLPKCKVGRPASGIHTEYLCFRFAGGYGVVAPTMEKV